MDTPRRLMEAIRGGRFGSRAVLDAVSEAQDLVDRGELPGRVLDGAIDALREATFPGWADPVWELRHAERRPRVLGVLDPRGTPPPARTYRLPVAPAEWSEREAG